jgi:cytoskeletal protein RodZ
MAQFTRVNGDLKPVLWLDAPEYTNTGVNAVTSAATVQPQGPKLDFFTATANGALTTTQVAYAIQTIEQLATMHIYEYTDDTNDTLAFAIYPTGAWTAAGLVAALEAGPAGSAWANAVTVTTEATFTN